MALGYVLVGVGFVIGLLGTGLPVLIAVMVVFTLGEMIALPVAQSHIASLAPDDMRGRYMGVLGVAWSAATMIGPSAGLALFAHSPALLWAGCGVLGAMAAISVAGIRRRAAEPDALPARTDGLLEESG